VVRRLLITLAVSLGLVGLMATVVGATPASPAQASVSAPITSAIAAGDDTWLVVPMGHLSTFLNTFWQLFVLTPANDRWVTVTPPGVADNGGLVITAEPGGTLLAGFLANQDLTFSPLSVTKANGQRWVGVYFPEGLVPVPDSLGGASGGTTLGLGGSENGSLLESSDLSSWRTITTSGRIGRTIAGERCGIGRLTAVALVPAGDVLVGSTCAHRGVIGLFDVAGDVHAVAFPASTIPSGATVSVLRLVPTATGASTLLAGHLSSGRTVLVAGWLTGPGPVSQVSAPFVMPAGSRLLASGTTPGGGVFVLVQPAGRGAPELADVAPSSAGRPAWDVLPPPPRGTLGAAFSPGRIDAVTVHSSTLIDYVFDQSTMTWVRAQVVHVSLQYGSSS
jgi:hypothetical protein